MALDAPLHLLLSYQERRDLKLSVRWLDPVPAPIEAGDQLGTLTININGDSRQLVLRAGQNVPVLGVFDRVRAAVKYLIFGATIAPSIAK